MFIIIKIFNIYSETVNKASFYPKALEEYFLLHQIRLFFFFWLIYTFHFLRIMLTWLSDLLGSNTFVKIV